LAAILVVAALLRALLLASFSNLEPVGDQLAYLGGAEELASGDVYTGSRGPAYSAFVSLCWSLTGSASGSLLAPRVGNLLLSLGFIAIVWAFGRRLVNARVGLAAAAVLAVHPNYVAFPLYLLSEQLYITSLAGGLLLALRSLGATWKPALAAGLVLGVGALTREMLVWFLPALAGVLVFLDRANFKRALFSSCALILGAALVILPWSAKSSAVHEEFVLIGFADGIPLFEGNFVPPAVLRRDTGKWKGRPVKQVRWNLFKEFNRTGARTKLAQNKRYRETAWKSVSERQPAWIFEKVYSNGPSMLRPGIQTPELWSETESTSAATLTRVWMLGLVLSFYALLYCLLPFGLARWRLTGPALIPLSYVGFAFAVHIVANAGPMRFQMPHEWILILAAASALFSSARLRRWVLAALIVLVIGAHAASLPQWTELGRALVTGEKTSHEDWQEEAMPFLEQDKARRDE